MNDEIDPMKEIILRNLLICTKQKIHNSKIGLLRKMKLKMVI